MGNLMGQAWLADLIWPPRQLHMVCGIAWLLMCAPNHGTRKDMIPAVLHKRASACCFTQGMELAWPHLALCTGRGSDWRMLAGVSSLLFNTVQLMLNRMRYFKFFLADFFFRCRWVNYRFMQVQLDFIRSAYIYMCVCFNPSRRRLSSVSKQWSVTLNMLGRSQDLLILSDPNRGRLELGNWNTDSSPQHCTLFISLCDCIFSPSSFGKAGTYILGWENAVVPCVCRHL